MLPASRLLLALGLLVSAIVSTSALPAAAQQSPPGPVRVTAGDGGVEIAWDGGAASPGRSALAANWPAVAFGPLRVPAQLVALRLPDGAPIDLRLTEAASVPWAGALADLVAAGDEGAQPAVAQLPAAPVTLLREGRVRGVRVAVLAVSALFAEGGAIRATSAVAASVTGATPFAARAGELLAASGPFLSAAPAPSPQATQPAVLLRVTQGGMQRVSGAALAAAGLDLATTDPSRLHLRRGGVEVALELRGSEDGRLDGGDEVRFFAPTPGDRWQSSDTYWLTLEAAPGLLMQPRPLGPANAPAATTAVERGVWRGTALYNPAFAGADGDHWFGGRLTAGPGTGPMALGVPLTATLPLASGTSVLTVTGSSTVATGHTLAATLGGATVQSSWTGRGNWSRRLGFATADVTTTLALLPGPQPDRIDIDSLAWERPVALSFGAQGAAFDSVKGTTSYQLAGTPPGAAFYDVSDPRQPQVLAAALPGGSFSFDDPLAPRSYLLAGPGTLHTPEVLRHQPVDLASPLNADLVMIAPTLFHGALQPLIERRTAQGHRVALVDPAAIYAAWSGGQIDPEAIRSFLRYAAATWATAPANVLLVGDGTSDPRNYTRRNNTTFVPPYLAAVDPYQGVVGLTVGETACESCYGQLDGDDPLGDPLPDLAVGRLPVKSAAEAAQVVAKIVGYEGSPPGGFWRSRVLFVSDNGTDAEGKIDPAGNFFTFVEQSIALQPAGIRAERLFYDPSPATSGLPGHERDAQTAFRRTKAALSAGAAFVTYTGHSHEFQWAVTDLAATPSYLLGLYDPDELTNGTQLPIVLEMTCLTGAFQTPAFSGTTIDERLLLSPKGGAVAVWGPTGKGVAHGHDKLQQGFFTEQWRGFPAGERPPLGALTLAGYLALFTQGGCCQDTIRTFALLGDPLTVPQARLGGEVLLPIVTR